VRSVVRSATIWRALLRADMGRRAVIGCSTRTGTSLAMSRRAGSGRPLTCGGRWAGWLPRRRTLFRQTDIRRNAQEAGGGEVDVEREGVSYPLLAHEGEARGIHKAKRMVRETL